MGIYAKGGRVLAVVLSTLVWVGCGKSSSGAEDFAKDMKVTFSPTKSSVIEPGENAVFDIRVTGVDNLKSLEVAKYREGEFVSDLAEVSKGSFEGDKYTYIYTVDQEDGLGNIVLKFTPVDIYDNEGETVSFTIEVTGHQLIPTGAKIVSRMTGATPAGENYPNPNRTDLWYNVGGTDLGIYWRMGGDKVGIVFGDTYGRDWRPGYTPDWRSNVLAFSTDTNLLDGLTFDDMVCDETGSAKEIIYSAHNTSGTGDWSSIPTAGIRIGTTDYIHYMNVKAWNPIWLTNWSGYASSTDGGQSWTLHKELFKSSSRFAQVALWEQGEWIYAMGSIIGRRGLPYLARFKGENILSPNKYEYWNSEYGWMQNAELSTTPLFGNYTNEMYAEPTLVYHDYFKRWISVYYNEVKGRLVMRDAPQPTGPWSEERLVVEETQYPELYGGFIHPLKLDGPYVYVSFTQWDPLYNVFLMRIDLTTETE